MTHVASHSIFENRSPYFATALAEDYAVYMLDPDGLITSWEPGIAKMKGYSAQEVLGKHFSIFHVDTEQKSALQAAIDALREARSCGRHASEGWLSRKDQTLFYAYLTIIALSDPGGQHCGFVTITKNLSSHKEAMDRLKQEIAEQSEIACLHEKRLRLLTDTLPNIVLEFDTQFKLRFANIACQRWFGRNESDLLGQCLKDILDAQTFAEIHPHLCTALTGKTISFETEICKDETKKSYLVQYIPELDQGNNVIGIISVGTDVTQLKEARLAAESANNAKSSFLANMAHEIRTPLGAVLGFSELLLKDNVTAQDRKMYQSAIVRNGSLLSDIINDVLDFAKIEAGTLQIERRDVSVVDILADTLSTLEFHANAKNIKLKTSIDCDTPRVIYTDPSRLKQILLNIVGNAIKFTENGAITIRVEPIVAQTGIRFIVEDTGIGISPEQAARLFTPFRQSDDLSRRRFSGTGLGLALSRQIAQLVGGDVQLSKTELDKGSIFTISITSIARPQDVSENFSPNNLKTPINHKDAPVGLKGTRILLVEDSPDNQLLVSRILQSAGANVVNAGNGVEALSETARSKFDVIVMDLQMPIMDGYQAAEALRQRGDKTPIVALTAHAMREELERCLAVGINAHLSKPINTQKLVATLAAMV